MQIECSAVARAQNMFPTALFIPQSWKDAEKLVRKGKQLNLLPSLESLNRFSIKASELLG